MSKRQEKLRALKKESRSLINKIRKDVNRLKIVLRESWELKHPLSEEGEDALFRLMKDWSKMTDFNLLLSDIKNEKRHVYEK